MNKWFFSIVACVAPLFLLTSCSKDDHVITIAATSVPQADLIEFVKPTLEKEGIKIKIVEMDDYALANQRLSEGEIDANFFQHIPYLEEQLRRYGYQLSVLARTHIEPMGIYSNKIQNFSELKNYSVVSIPNDPTNEARALLLMQKCGLIKVISKNIFTTSVLDISENPHKLVIREIGSPMLARSLNDSTLAVVPTNFAIQAGLNPEKALCRETANSPYVNVVVVRTKDLNKPEMQKLKEALNSEAMREYILTKYKGEIIPAFSPDDIKEEPKEAPVQVQVEGDSSDQPNSK